MRGIGKTLIAAAVVGAGLMAAGCSSSPSDEEMKQLNDLRAEVQSLQQQAVDKQAEKSALEKQNADKKAKLQQCESDQAAVKSALGK